MTSPIIRTRKNTLNLTNANLSVITKRDRVFFYGHGNFCADLTISDITHNRNNRGIIYGRSTLFVLDEFFCIKKTLLFSSLSNFLSELFKLNATKHSLEVKPTAWKILFWVGKHIITCADICCHPFIKIRWISGRRGVSLFIRLKHFCIIRNFEEGFPEKSVDWRISRSRYYIVGQQLFGSEIRAE